MRLSIPLGTLISTALLGSLLSCSHPATTASTVREKASVKVHWDKVIAVSKTTPSLQVVVNPPLRRGSKIHDTVFKSLQEMGLDYIRYVPWLPYPKLGVAELEPPKDGKTSWDFSLIDPMMEDLVNATAGHPIVLNFSTIPQWMFKTDKPVPYPADPDQPVWNYQQGTEPRDPSYKEIADYYARLASWYTQGGFTDEFGQRHESGHHYKIDYWEILNEIDYEHTLSPQHYTKLYDAVVTAVRKVQPKMKFVALALAYPAGAPDYFEYFLNPRNHQPGIPLDMISYHFYASPKPDENPGIESHTYVEQAERFIATVRYIQSIRQRLSPKTETDADELGSIDASDFGQGDPGYVFKGLPASYWNLSGATYAYVYAELAKLGVEVAGESQWVGYPSQYPSVSMVDWNTGLPNARAQVLRLIHQNFGPGDKLVATDSTLPYVYAQGFITRDGKRRVLLINQRDRTFDVEMPVGNSAAISYVDQTTASQPPAAAQVSGGQMSLSGLSVVVVTLPQ